MPIDSSKKGKPRLPRHETTGRLVSASFNGELCKKFAAEYDKKYDTEKGQFPLLNLKLHIPGKTTKVMLGDEEVEAPESMFITITDADFESMPELKKACDGLELDSPKNPLVSVSYYERETEAKGDKEEHWEYTEEKDPKTGEKVRVKTKKRYLNRRATPADAKKFRIIQEHVEATQLEKDFTAKAKEYYEKQAQQESGEGNTEGEKPKVTEEKVEGSS